MALKLLPLMTGPEGLVRQSLTGEQASLAYQLEQARKRKNDTMGGVEQHREAKADMARLSDALVAAKDQSRVGGLPPEPMPPDGDVTVIEKGAGQQPIVAPVGVGGGAETAFTPIPPDRFGDPSQMASSQQIQDAFARRQTMMAQAPEAPPAPPPTPTPPAPMVAAAQPPARPTVPERLNIGAEDWQRAQGNDLGGWISLAANELGVDAIDLATAISYETAGTFGLNTKGPRTKWGQHRGLIQWGEPQAAKYLNNDFSVASQMRGMVDYLRDAGVQPGMGLMDIYSAINAGQVGRYGASDAAAGGAPGTVADKVNNQMAGHRRKAIALLGGELEPTDEDWIRGGESTPSTALAYNAENAPMTPQGHPQADLISLLAAQQPPMAYAQSNWTPLAQAAPQTELSQAAPIVQGGGNQVSFGGDAVATPEQIDNRKALAAAMIAQGQGGGPIGHPLQAAGQVAQSAAGAYGMHRANQQELQRRQALAQALMAARGGGSLDPLYGVDPDRAFEIEEARAAAAADAEAQRARNEEWRERERYKRELDQEYAAPPQPPTSVREYEYGQENPDFADRQLQLKRAGATTIEGNKYGTIPSGHQLIEGEGGVRMEPIPGSPAAMEAEESKRQEEARRQIKESSGNIVTEDIGRAYDMAKESPTWRTGTLGSLMEHVPGSGAHDLSNLLDTVRANTAFDALQKMREASPTGGALGAVSERELALLEATKGALKQSQSDEQLLYNLARLNDQTLDIVHGPTWRDTNPELSIAWREGKAAIEKGKDRTAVNARLQQMGLPPIEVD